MVLAINLTCGLREVLSTGGRSKEGFGAPSPGYSCRPWLDVVFGKLTLLESVVSMEFNRSRSLF